MGVEISVWNTATHFEAAAITAINYMSVDAPCQQFSAGGMGVIADYNDNHVDLSDWRILRSSRSGSRVCATLNGITGSLPIC